MLTSDSTCWTAIRAAAAGNTANREELARPYLGSCAPTWPPVGAARPCGPTSTTPSGRSSNASQGGALEAAGAAHVPSFREFLYLRRRPQCGSTLRESAGPRSRPIIGPPPMPWPARILDGLAAGGGPPLVRKPGRGRAGARELADGAGLILLKCLTNCQAKTAPQAPSWCIRILKTWEQYREPAAGSPPPHRGSFRPSRERTTRPRSDHG